MPLLPDPIHTEAIQQACLSIYESGTHPNLLDITNQLLNLPELPMHCPAHHFLTCAALLTAAHLRADSSCQRLLADLKTARERTSILPGGTCGQYGCCGAAMGAGVFFSIWCKTSPMSKNGWAAANQMTSRCLASVAQVEGPRCCKRVTYLTISAAAQAARELMDLDLGPLPPIHCHHSQQNRECRLQACPFYSPESPNL